MEDLRFYVYAHQRKDNGKCFHIGKGTGNRYKDKNFRNNHWHNIVNKHGFTPVILVSGLSEEKAYELEASFVKQIGVENLANLAEPKYNGSFAHSEESKRKIGEKNKGKQSLETCLKKSQATKGKLRKYDSIEERDAIRKIKRDEHNLKYNQLNPNKNMKYYQYKNI